MAFCGFVVLPLADFYAERADRLAERKALAERMERLVAQLPTLKARAELLDRAGPTGSLNGSSDAVAGAALQNIMQDIAASVGASLTSVEGLPTEPSGAGRRIGIKVALSASWPVLIRLIDATGHAATPVFIDDLQIRTGPLPTRGGPQPLEAGFNVYGFAVAPKDKTP